MGISKPKLSDKWLYKPPFRFLHDIIVEVVKQTAFAAGLFSLEECDTSRLSTKAQRVEFLNKVIAVVSFALDEGVDVCPNRILAGQEADKTNRFLQQLNTAARTCTSA